MEVCGRIPASPEFARERIRAAAEKALRRFIDNREQSALVKLEPPFRSEVRYRSNGTNEARTMYSVHPDSVIEFLNGKLKLKEPFT